MKVLPLALFTAWVVCAASQDNANARQLFEEAQEHLKAGQAGMAKVSFETLIAVYPESSLVWQAREGLRLAEEQEPKRPVVRSIRFEHFHRLKVEEVLDRLKLREVPLAVENPFDFRSVDEARNAIRELLAEKGVTGHNVRADTREVAPNSIAITFRLVKD